MLLKNDQDFNEDKCFYSWNKIPLNAHINMYYFDIAGIRDDSVKELELRYKFE